MRWPLLLLLVCAVIRSHAQTPAAAIELAAKVDHHYNALHSLRVEFTESYAGMGISRSESGTMLLKKPGKMRWSYSSPAGKLFVLDGKFAWFYAPGDAQVQRLPAGQLDDLRSPLRFLLGHSQLTKELGALTLIHGDQVSTLEGVPRGMEKRVASIALGVTADGEIRSMTITEIAGARTSFTFSDEQPNVPVSAEDFVFRPPAGVPVVEGLPPI
jgi:outer membrane lipoprotein carrier protein